MIGMRRGLVLAFVLAGCHQTASTPDGALAPDAAPPPPWWQPKPGDARNWDIQIHAPFDISAARTMYVLNLWDVVPSAQTLDYKDNDPVTVPAGQLATAIAELHGRTPQAIVVCRIETGTLELAAPDARKFPGYEASPPDMPTAPKAGSVIGWSTDTAGERYLDLGHIDLWKTIMFERFALAKTIGCDAVLGDGNDTAYAAQATGNTAGFMFTLDDQNAWYRAIADDLHTRKLSAGMKDAAELPDQADMLAPVYDWILIQRCAEYQDCDGPRPFINLHKAVLDVDYQINAQQMTGIDPTIACPRQLQAMIDDGLVKDEALSKTFRYQCLP